MCVSGPIRSESPLFKLQLITSGSELEYNSICSSISPKKIVKKKASVIGNGVEI